MIFDFNRYPFRNLYPELADIKLDYTPISPQNFIRGKKIGNDGKEKEVLFDFGEERVGYLSVEISGKGKCRINYAEWYDEIYKKSLEFVDWYETPCDKFNVDSESPVSVKVEKRRAFRYVLLTVEEGEVVIENVVLQAVGCKKNYNGYFRCSDSMLNSIYDISKRTTDLCMQKYFEDGIKRDGLLWSGDARIEILCNYAIFGNTDIVKNSVKYFIRSMREDGWIPPDAVIGGAEIHPSAIDYMFDFVGGGKADGVPFFYSTCGEMYYLNYSCDFISIVYEYYMYSGDLAFLKEVFGYLQKCIRRLCTIDKTDTAGKLIPQVYRKGRKYIDNMCDTPSYLCQLVDTLKIYKTICDVLGNQEEILGVEKYITEYTVEAKKYFDGKGLLYRNMGNDGKNVCVPQGQAFALSAGLCSKEEYTQIIEKFETDDCAYPECGKSKFWWLKGVFESGNVTTALKIIREQWGVLVNRGDTTCMERWDARHMEDVEGDYVLSGCHGWSAGPAALLPQYVLGVTAMEAGYKKVSIAPNLGDLEFAEGTVTTPLGLIYVKATKDGVEYTVPDGIEVV